MRVIAFILLVVFATSSVVVAPAHATRREDREKPPPRDNDDRRPEPDRRPDRDEGPRAPRERGDQSSRDRSEYDDCDYRDYYEDDDVSSNWDVCWCGRTHCSHRVSRRSAGYAANHYDYRRDAEPAMGLFGLAAITVLALNIRYAGDNAPRKDGLAIAGLALGATGVVWSVNADRSWQQRALFLAGVLSVGAALYQLSDDPHTTDPESVKSPAPAASISFSF